MNCIRCHREIPDGSAFCNLCGKRQTTKEIQRKGKHRRPNKTGSVYKLSGKREKPWAAWAGGKIIGTFPESSQAVLALDAFNASSLSRDHHNDTFKDCYDAWKKVHFSEIGEKGTYSYESAFKVSAQIHTKKMREIKTSEFQAIIDELLANGKSRSLCEKQKQLFSQLCKYAMQEDLMDKNYAEFVKLPKPAEKKTRIFSEEEIESIKKSMEREKFCKVAKIAYALICTGMRINELLSVTIENTHIEERYVVGGEKTEAGKNRVIPLSESVVPVFMEWKSKAESIPGNILLVPSSSGTRLDYNNVQKLFSALMKHLHITGATLHTCRHTAATRMVESGMNPAIIKEILGHANFSTTVNTYTHVDVKNIVSELQKMA